MILLLRAINSKQQLQEFSCQLDRIETALGFLNEIVNQGSTLLQVQLLEYSVRTELPVSAFDGHICLQTLSALQQEWEDILNQASSTALSHQMERISMLRRQLQHCERRIADEQLMISRLEEQSKTSRNRFFREPTRSQITNYYTSLINRRWEGLTLLETRQEVLTTQLSKLNV